MKSFTETVALIKNNEWLQRIGSAVVWLSLVSLVRFWPWFFSGKTLFFGDLFSLFVPGKLFSAEWLMRGETPYWNPYIFGGVSWWGDISQSVTYPSTWLFGWLAPAEALMVTIVSHWWLLLLGTYLVVWQLSLRHYASLIAAVAVAASPPLTSLLHNLAMLQTVAWWPWIVLAALRMPVFSLPNLEKAANPNEFWQWWKWCVPAAAVIASQWYAGYPTLAVLSLGVATITLLLHHRVGLKNIWVSMIGWVCAVALGTVWATPALWPFVQALLSSTRVEAGSSLTASIHFAEVVKVLFPFVFEFPWWGMRWGPVWTHPPTPILYLSSVAILIGGVFLLQGKKILSSMSPGEKTQCMVWGSSVVLSVVLSLVGAKVGLGFIRLPVVWQVLAQWSAVMVGVSLIGPLSRVVWLKNAGISQSLVRNLLVTSGVVLTVLLIVAVGISRQPEAWWNVLHTLSLGKLSASGFHTVARDQVISVVGLLSLGVMVGGAAGLMLAWRLRSASGLFLVLAAEFLFTSQVGLFFLPRSVLDKPELPPAVEQSVELSEQQGWRVLTRNSNAAYADLPGYWEALLVRAPFSDSFIDRTELENGTHLKSLSRGLAPNWHQLYGISSLKGYGTFVPNEFKNWKNTDGSLPINALPEVSITDSNLSQWATKYYLVDSWYVLPFSEVNDLIQIPKIADDERWKLFVLPWAKPRVLSSTSSAEIAIHDFTLTPNTELVTVSYQSDTEFIAQFADRYEPGWSVFVDGQPTEAVQGKGVELPSTGLGQSIITQVAWVYTPPGVEAAQFIASLSVIFLAGAAVVFFSTHRFER